MARINKSHDTDHHLIVNRYGNGIKLIRPNEIEYQKNTIQELFDSNLNVFFIDTQSVILDINENTINNCGFKSKKSTLGNTVAIVANKETAEFEFHHDKEVVHSNQIIIREENFTKKNDPHDSIFVNIKFPWYNQENRIVGVFGIAILLDSTSISHSLISLLQTGLLGSSIPTDAFTASILPGKKIGSVYISKRESEVLEFLIQGKTAKETALILNLSYRTIEFYIANLKRKLKVYTKSQLIEKVLQGR